ncbi:leucyl/phenylalanyl-tRNA--protein transferase [Vibrio hippocampi]|uniref:Leucyl/phenylalanyl-tRNA--protein transferase n=1 Tax=Vibrio hippocampi TaxID=654686 RepID=A0ABN8DGC1_9VIBR|nr:leucyl/phenylalanyl-tRNA--protein transferase [Vibrio hippocampi]CAH0525576.1 Leucyl/phenylalanyl-tRNA--protein transferase [Vibrio hippocampi]
MTLYLPELALDNFAFPSPFEALCEPNGLLAFGGDLNPQRILCAYQNGIFPWFGPDEPILWWSPAPRAVFDPSDYCPSKSLRKHQRKVGFKVTINQATNEVIKLCAELRPPEETWLSSDMQQAYSELAKQGHCHSVEVWQDERLVGGLYGLSIGRLFCGESMFSLVSNASKTALWYFCHHFARKGGQLIDCQVMNPHLASLGAKELTRSDFIDQLLQHRSQSLPLDCFVPQELFVSKELCVSKELIESQKLLVSAPLSVAQESSISHEPSRPEDSERL